MPLTGIGAAIDGARWNSPGTKIIYTTDSRALALAELSVHLTAGLIFDDYVMLTIQIPDDISIEELDPKTLPSNWNQHPYTKLTQKTGNDFILRNTSPVLKTPSAVVPGDFNYLINPAHPDFKKINILETVDFPFDDRLFAK